MNSQNVGQPVPVGKSRLANCLQICANVNAGILLYRIGHWDRWNLRKGKADRWSANSFEDWAEDTGLSFDQVKRAMNLLRDRNLIEVKRTMFQSRNVLHVRLSDRSLGIFQQASFAPFEQGSAAPLEECKTAPFHVQEEPTVEQQIEPSVLTNACDPDTECKEAEPMPMVKDVLNAVKKTGPVSGSLQLPIMFTELYAQQSGKFAPTLSVIQKKLLKDFDKKCPGGSGKHTLRTCCENWIEFTQRVKQEAGIFTVPDHPKVEFLNKYAHIAISFTPKATGGATVAKVETPKNIFGGFTMKQKADPDA